MTSDLHCYTLNIWINMKTIWTTTQWYNGDAMLENNIKQRVATVWRIAVQDYTDIPSQKMAWNSKVAKEIIRHQTSMVMLMLALWSAAPIVHSGGLVYTPHASNIYSRRRVHAKNSRGVKFLWPPSIFSDCEVAFTLGGCGNVIHNDAWAHISEV